MMSGMLHACPCCGFRSLTSRGDYELCPVCFWEDDGDLAPWEVSGPNGGSVAEAQRRFLADRRPFLVRKHVRAPRDVEARDPGWAPYVWDAELEHRVARAREEWESSFTGPDPAEVARADAELAGWNASYGEARWALETEIPSLTQREVEERLRSLAHERGLMIDDATVELWSRRMRDERWALKQPWLAAWWLVRHARPRTWSTRLRELRTGSINVSG